MEWTIDVGGRARAVSVAREEASLAVSVDGRRFVVDARRIAGGLTLLVCLVLYFFGGSGIHAFAFALVIGVISGTYSTVFIAAPILLWLIGKPAAVPAASSTSREMAKTSA